MSHTISVRITNELAEWLASTARRTRQPKGRIVREQLERARAAEKQGFMRLAGAVERAEDLSARRGFSRK